MIFPVYTYDVVPSTMLIATDLAKTHRMPFCVQALKQTNGYGRQQRPWHSIDPNLYTTIAFKSKIPSSRWYEFSFVAAIAVLKTVHYFIGTSNVLLKWPNDILVQGKKIAGILIEVNACNEELEEDNIILMGIGFNCVNIPLDTTISLKELNSQASAKQVLEKLLFLFQVVYDLWDTKGFLYIMQFWRRHGPVHNSPMSFKHNHIIYTGTFDHIDDYGKLYLKTEEGLMAFRSGDVLMPHST